MLRRSPHCKYQKQVDQFQVNSHQLWSKILISLLNVLVIWIHCSSNVTRRHNLLNFDRVNSPNYSVLVTWKNMHTFLEHTANTAMQLSDSCLSEDLGCIAFWDPTWIEKVVLVHQHIYHMNNTKTCGRHVIFWKITPYCKFSTMGDKLFAYRKRSPGMTSL